MLKKLSAAMLAMVSFVSLSSAVGFDNSEARSLQEEIGAISVDEPSVSRSDDKGLLSWLFGRGDQDRSAPKKWTIMVYINGKNDLERFALKDVNEMEIIGSSDKVNIVVEMGRMAGYDSSDGDWKGVRRYLVTRDNDLNRVSSRVVEDLGTSDMGDYRNVIKFGKWAKEKYPAEKYMFIMWNHGSGWVKSNKSIGGNKGISYDEETRHNLSTPQIAAALKGIGGINVYGSDACLMQMAEVVYELKDHVEYIVGSEETEPGDGYTYDLLLRPIVNDPNMSPEQLGRVAVDGYSDHYAQIRQGSTQSLVRSSAISGFLSASNRFVSAVMQANEKALVKRAMAGAQAYAYPENKDLYHFTQLVVNGSSTPAVKDAGRALMSYISSQLVAHNRTNNGAAAGPWSPATDYSNSHGIAVFLPGTAANADYNALQWAKASNWDEFMNWIARP